MSTDSSHENDGSLGRLRPREAEWHFRFIGPGGRQALAANAPNVDDHLLGVMLEDPTVWPILAANGRLSEAQQRMVADTLLSALEVRRGQRPFSVRFKAAARGLRALTQAKYDFTAPQLTKIRRILTKGNALAAGHAALDLHDTIPGFKGIAEAAMKRAVSSSGVGREVAVEYLGRDDLPITMIKLIVTEWGRDWSIAQSVLRHPSATIASWARVSKGVVPWKAASLWNEVFRLACVSPDPCRLVWTLENVPSELMSSIVLARPVAKWAASVPAADAQRALVVLANRAPAVFLDMVEADGIPPGVTLQPDDYLAVFQADNTQERAIAALGILARAR
jgi:hypothetical protein